MNAGLVRRVWLVSVAALPFACSVYGPDALQGRQHGGAGTAGTPFNPPSTTAGDTADGGSMNRGGAGQTAGMTGAGGSLVGGASGFGGATKGGASSFAAAGEGGATSSAGNSASAGDGGVGDAGAAGTGGSLVIPGLVASFPCESASGAVLPDTSGHNHDATLANGGGGALTGFAFGTGLVGNALSLSAADMAYVSLPPSIVSPLDEATIATWVKLKSGAAFQRVFDFGVDTSTFMYMANAGSSGLVRFRIASSSLNKNQVVEGAQALPVGKWVHVAVTIGNNGVTIYVDAVQVAQQTPAALRPSDLGATANNFIGRSPFAADPYLDGQIDEFRIYNRVLSSTEIASLANVQ